MREGWVRTGLGRRLDRDEDFQVGQGGTHSVARDEGWKWRMGRGGIGEEEAPNGTEQDRTDVPTLSDSQITHATHR